MLLIPSIFSESQSFRSKPQLARYLTSTFLHNRNRITWAKATRDLWTDEEVDQYLQDRKRKSCKLDPSLNLPSWCAPAAEKDAAAGKPGADAGKPEPA